MLTIDDINLKNYNERMAIFARELNLAPPKVVQMQAGLLVRELVDNESPRDLASLERNITRDVKKKVAPMPSEPISAAHRDGKGFVWLVATPDSLTGVRNENYLPGISVEALRKDFYSKQFPKTKYNRIGKRGKQAVQEIQRIVTKRSTVNALIKSLKSAGGKLKAAWAVSWDVLQIQGRRPPQWVMRHVGGKAKGSFIDGLGIPGKATFTLINNATGVENPKSIAAINNALKSRAIKMAADLKLYIQGVKKRSGLSKYR